MCRFPGLTFCYFGMHNLEQTFDNTAHNRSVLHDAVQGTMGCPTRLPHSTWSNVYKTPPSGQVLVVSCLCTCFSFLDTFKPGGLRTAQM